MRFVCVCRRPAVSTMTTSRPRACAASIASKATAAGSAPCVEPTKSAPARFAQISSCSSAAARKVSAAATTTEWPWSRRRDASLPIVVVFPVPLTPTTRITVGSSPRARDGRSPSAVIISSTSSWRPWTSSPSFAGSRASSCWTSSTVAGTPTSARISASSTRSHDSASAGLKKSSWVSALRLPASDSRRRPNQPRRPVLLVSPLGLGVVAEKLGPARHAESACRLSRSPASRFDTIWETPSAPIVTP